MAETEKFKRISVRDANQGFSRLIAEVEKGARFIVTKNNREVARLEPMVAADDQKERERKEAWARIEKVMSAGYRSQDGGWDYKGRREDLHDRSV